MKYYVTIDSEKNVISLDSHPEKETMPVPFGCVAIEVDALLSFDQYWVDDAMQLQTRNKKPSIFHHWNGTDWIIDEPAHAEWLAQDVRLTRNRLLSDCDWTQARDIPDSTAMAWQPYRKALRDITLQAGFPLTIIWPIMP